MTKPKLIIFNAPKSCGKDKCVEYLISQGLHIERLECKEQAITLTKLFFNVQDDIFEAIYDNRDLKELPNTRFTVPLIEGIKLFQRLGYSIDETPAGDVIFFDKSNNVRYPMKDKYTLSIREAVIYISELVMKPLQGEDYFGKVRASRYDPNFEGVYVDSSSGFSEEYTDIIKTAGQSNILAVRIHREGYTFEGDSRSPIEDYEFENIVDIQNDGTVEELQERVYKEVVKFLGE